MSEDTTIITKPDDTVPNGNSAIFGVSIRAWLALFLVYTVCLMSVFGMKVEEPLYSLSIGALGFYFGQNIKKP